MAREREEGKMRGIAQSIRELWKGKADVDVGFRTIRTSWMLLLVAAAYTVIISPYMLLTPLYQSQYLFVTIFVLGICIVAWLGDLVGKNIIKKYFQDEIIKGKEHKLPLSVLRLAQASIIMVFFILILDGVSVAEESYYYVHIVSYISLVITIIFLILPITIMRKRGG